MAITPEEIEANAGVIQRLLSLFGATRQAALRFDREQNPAERAIGSQLEVADRNPPPEPATLGMLPAPARAPQQPPQVNIPSYTTPTGEVRLGEPARNTAGPESLIDAPSLPQNLLGLGFGAATPFGTGPSSSTVYQSPGQTVTGRELPPVARTLEAPSIGDPDAANVGRLVAGPPVGRALQIGGNIAERAAAPVVRFAGRNPAVTAPAAVAAVTAGTSAETQRPPSQLDQARERVTTLNMAQEGLNQALTDARGAVAEFNRRFGNIGPSSSEGQIRELQGFLANAGLYNSTVDGRWRAFTQQAVAEWRRNATASVTEAQTALTRHSNDLTAANRRVADLERTENAAETFADLPSWQQWAIHNPQAAGIIGGLALGPAVRAGRVGVSELANWRARSRMDALVNPEAPINQRVAGMNTLYARAGGREPFVRDPMAPQQLAASPNQQTVSELFPQPGFMGSRFGPVDVAAPATFALAGARTHFLSLPTTTEELNQARAAFDANGSRENAQRLRTAEYNHAMALIARNSMLGAATGYPISALARGPTPAIPNISRAQTEVYELNRLLAPVETWTSPRGRLRVTRDRDTGRLIDQQGRTVTEPELRRKGWQRISEAETEATDSAVG